MRSRGADLVKRLLAVIVLVLAVAIPFVGSAGLRSGSTCVTLKLSHHGEIVFDSGPICVPPCMQMGCYGWSSEQRNINVRGLTVELDTVAPPPLGK